MARAAARLEGLAPRRELLERALRYLEAARSTLPPNLGEALAPGHIREGLQAGRRLRAASR